MIEVVISREQLEKALQAVNESTEDGFAHSLAILRLTKVGQCVSDCEVEYEAVILKAHPTDPSLDWGRATDTTRRWYQFVDGRCVTKEEPR